MSFLVCPRCRSGLSLKGAEATCRECAGHWPVREGIVHFEPTESKYEETPAAPWDHTGPGWKLPFVDAGITWFFSKVLPAGGRALDVGCGVGMRFHAARFDEVCGVDLAPRRLKVARELYTEVSVASVLALPYPDAFFDAVVSVDVMEHIPAPVKDQALAEMMRVLRPGGVMAHVLDLDSQKPLYRWAQKHEVLWQKYFIDQMGHYGLETATAAIRRFDATGMDRILVEATNRTSLQHPENFAWQFDNEYRSHSFCVRAMTSLSYRIRRHRYLRALYSGFFQLAWARTLEKLFPLDWAFNLSVAYRRR